MIYRYRLAETIPVESSATYAEISAASGLNESLCLRFIRTAIGLNIFDEDSNGRVRHTAISKMLATNQGFRDGLGLHLEEFSPSATQLSEVWNRFGQDVGDPTKTCFNLYNGTVDKSIYEILAQDPERTRRFGGAMEFYTYGDNLQLGETMAEFDWAALDKPNTTVVDLGGGVGTVSQFLARHTKHINFVVQEMPAVVAEGSAKLPVELKDRVSFETRDFFEPHVEVQEDRAPAAFLLRWILHNWSDDYCVKILRSLIPAFKKGTKLLIYDIVLEDGPVKDLTGHFGFQMDMTMCALYNALERRVQDFERIFKATDERLVLTTVRKPKRAQMSIVEAEWLG
jgi:hypothetical protein